MDWESQSLRTVGSPLIELPRPWAAGRTKKAAWDAKKIRSETPGRNLVTTNKGAKTEGGGLGRGGKKRERGRGGVREEVADRLVELQVITSRGGEEK